MTDEELCYASIGELAPLLASSKVSPVTLAEAVLARIDKLNPRLNAFLTVTADQARVQARAAEQEIRAGRYRGPLHGIPISLKDIIATRGVRTTAGSKILADWVPDHDAAVVERLAAAGAVLIGKNTLHEFAFASTSINPHYGPVRNPWDRERIPAGSSGGSAVAVAAGLGCASIGSETGASIRRPAAFCGCVGFKPTFGRVSRHGVVPHSWSLDHLGPLTRSVADAAVVFEATAGRDPRDAATTARALPDLQAALGQGVRGLRLGVPRAYLDEGVHHTVLAAFVDMVAALTERGAQMVDVTLPTVQYTAITSTTLMLAECGTYHRPWLRTRAADYGVDVRERLQVGACLGAAEYLMAQRARRAIARDVRTAFERIDALVAPAAMTPATPIAEGAAALGDAFYGVGHHAFNLVRLPSLLGLPAIAVPCGATPEGLPLGLQVIGRAFDEATPLRIAHAVEQAQGPRPRPPV